MSLDCDVAVIGAGPAGAIAAHQLASDGADVVLIDKGVFPRFKVCGCCLNPDALGTLAKVGMASAVRALGGEPLARMEVRAGGRRADVALPGGLAVSRAALDEALVASATGRGARLVQRSIACGVEAVRNGWGVSLRERGTQARRTLTARFVVAADGLGGSFLRSAPGFENEVEPDARIGIGTIVEAAGTALDPGTVRMACGRAGYCGVVRLEGGRIALAAAVDRTYLRRSGGPGAATARLLADAGAPELAGLEDADWQGTPELTRRPRPLAQAGVYPIGDAAGYVEPFTGEGMAWALASGKDFAELARTALEVGQLPDPQLWAMRHHELCRHRRCRRVARGLRHPALVRAGVVLAGHYPAIGAALIRPFGRVHARAMVRPLH